MADAPKYLDKYLKDELIKELDAARSAHLDDTARYMQYKYDEVVKRKGTEFVKEVKTDPVQDAIDKAVNLIRRS